MKTNKLYIAIILLTSIFSSSCESNFLDVDSREIVEADDSEVVLTPENFVNGVYGMFTDFNYAFAYIAVTEIISDNADKGSSPTDMGNDKGDLDNLMHSITTASFASLWTHWYKSIGRASEAIKFIENYGLTDTVYKNRLIGEAKFLRALNYFYLVRGWGDVTIQEIDLMERKPASEVYAYIEKDLTDAIEILPLKSAYAPADLGRATKGAAQGLLAKVYLYQKKWQAAYDLAQTVITSGQYDLESDYAVLWRLTSENGKESLFEFQGRGEALAHGIHQYSETQGARGPSGWGWGFNTPSENLLEAFNAEGDFIRRDATIIFRGETLYDGRVVSTATENPMYNEKAYSSANIGAADGDKNIRYLRLGEIYLIAAETANELGDTDNALKALNKIRNRVSLDSISTTDQIQLRSIIYKERRLELAFEHDRWFDLVRTGQAPTAMATIGKTFLQKHYLFPIPNAQLIQTPTMSQNLDW